MGQQGPAYKLHRSSDAWLGGVCAGLAERYDCDAIMVRILVLIVVLMTLGLGALVYMALWATLPEMPASVYEVSPENAESSSYGAIDETGRPYMLGRRTSAKETLSIAIWGIVALCLMLLFFIVTVNISPMVEDGLQWWQLWPLGGVIVGVGLIVVPLGGKRKMAVHALGVIVVSAAVTCLPMSFEVLPWDSLAFALQHQWLLGAVALVLFGVGAYRADGAMAIAGAFVFAVFCLIMLVFYAAPGDLSQLLIRLPGGRSLYISF